MDQTATQTVLITGAARRIGRAIALDLAGAGWNVAAHYGRSAADAASLKREIEALGRRCAVLEADLGDADAAHALIERAGAALGPIDCLVNNASRFEMDRIGEVTGTSWDAHMNVNARAPLLLVQAFAAQLAPGRTGNVINLLDQRVWNVTPYFLSYTASKMALWSLTQALALALAPRVRVNAIGPGPALRSARQSAAQFQAQCEAMPLGRGTSPAEIAATVRFILAAPALTGQMIALDGGQHLGWSIPKAPPEVSA